MPAPKAVVVGGAAYPSIGAAARANYIDRSTLSNALSSGNAECCGLSIRYADEGGAARRRPYESACKPVMVDGVRYPSIEDAAKAVRCDASTLSRALSAGRRKLVGRRIEYER